MSGRPTYLPGAIARIKGLGEKAITAFFNEIPRGLLNVVTGHLPPFAGFRPGTNAAVQRQLQSLTHKIAARRIPKGFSRSSEEAALYGLWNAWSRSQIAETAVVGELLDGLDEEEDAEEGGAPDTSERMAGALKALVASGTCARETLERFVTFSPFENVEGFLALVRGARTAAEIRRDSTLLDLPDRLHKDEARLQLLETKLDAADRNASLIRTDLEEMRRAVSNLRTNAAEDRAAMSELKKTTGAAIGSQKTIEETLARLTHVTDRLAGRVAVNEKQAGVIAERHGLLESDVVRTAQSLSHLSEQLTVYGSRLDQVSADVRGRATELQSQHERLSGLEKLVVRIDQLESMVLELGEAKSSKEAAVIPSRVEQITRETAPQHMDPALLVTQLRLEPGLSVRLLGSVTEILFSLDAALVEAGLKKSAAVIFAEEILAAVASEQIVFLRGGFAVDVARKCALSLSGTSVFRVAIPLGLTDPSLFRQRLGNRLSPASGILTSIVVEGVNNSPLDLVRDVLLDQVTYRVGSSGRQTPTIIFASLADGAGAFPIEPSYLELGPVFDLEQMDWRRLRREKLPVLGSVTQNDWQSIVAACDGKTVDYEEALQGAKGLAPKRNARFEANVVRAFSALTTIRREQDLTALQSVTFGWLAPYWQTVAAKADDIDAQIDGGKCDGTVVDERLKSILAEYRGQSTGEHG